jgi:hypothetical protein
MTSPAAPPVASPLSGPPRPRGGLTFRAPEEEEETTWTTLDQLAGEGTSPSDPLADSPSDSEWTSAEDEDESSDESGPTSSRGSSADSVRPMSARAQRAAARQAVKIAGAMAHQYLAHDEAAKAVGLYLVDDETAAQIGDPLARIAARHAGPTGAIANPDVADGIAALLGVAKFVSITVERSSAAAAQRAQSPERSPQPTPVGL